MKQTYSEGPWNNDNGSIKATAGGSTWTIARMTCSTNPNLPQGANGALVASAPELLAALEACTALLRGVVFSERSEAPEVIAEARAAIRKARGEE
jgi:hypothetical protein